MKSTSQKECTEAKFNSQFRNLTFLDHFKQKYGAKKTHMFGCANLFSEPFLCCQLKDFIEDQSFICNLQSELNKLELYKKDNDLYKFRQSSDLKNIKSKPHIKALTTMLSTEVRLWLKDVTGIPLYDTIDLTCSKYKYTDVLLCHDDELEGRRIAFIMYLTPDEWSTENGGQLCLFNTDEHGQPKEIMKKLIPQRNSFVFFEVTPTSFHQVEEVLSKNKVRWSVAGWFHGPNIERPHPYIEPVKPLSTATDIQTEEVKKWLNVSYLDIESALKHIQSQFEEESEIQLENFFLDNKFEEISHALQSDSVVWTKRGPPNKRNLYVADEGNLPKVLQDCLHFMKSEFMFYLLEHMTGLNLTEKTQGSKPKKAKSDSQLDGDTKQNIGEPSCRAELRKWCHGSYTLAHDTDTEAHDYALDVSIFTHCNDWKECYGGFISYIANGEDEELLTVNPSDNSLSLVYRDHETLRFTKHINHQITEIDTPEFYEIYVVFYE